jgi:plastocyanin
MDALKHQAWRTSAGWTVGLLVVSLMVAGCGGSSAAPPNQATVHIAGNYYGQFSFNPATTTIKVGMTVVWTNDTGTPHTSTSDAGSAVTWNSGLINPGSSFSFTFTQTGTFAYHCNVHAYMHGTIVVTT